MIKHMASGVRLFALAVAVAVWAGCRPAPPVGLGSGLASCIPADTRVLAGAHLPQIRSNPLLRKALSDWLPMLDRAGEASAVVIAYNGKDLLWAATGPFRAAPPGATLLAPELAVAGPPLAVRAAAAQHSTGKSGSPALVAVAGAVAAQPIWAVVAGGTHLPLPGNAANLNRLLALTQYATFSLDAGRELTLRSTGICGSAAEAQHLEETIRGILTLAGASTRDPALAPVASGIRIRRDGQILHLELAAAPGVIDPLLRAPGQ